MPDSPFAADAALDEEIYKTLFEHMLNGMVYARLLFEQGVAVDFIYLAVNPAFLFQTGFADVVGRRSSDIVPNLRVSNPELLECYARVAAGGGAEKFEVFIGVTAQWYEIVVYSPRAQYFVVVFDVITQRKDMQADTERLQAQLQQAQKMEAIGQLTGGIAHDFNNILATILGFVEIASRDSAVTAGGKMQGYLAEVKLAAERATELIQKMLIFSRALPGKAAVLALPPAPAVREILRLMAVLMPRDIRIDTRCDEAGPIAMTAVDLQQLLMNLIINARDAILETGSGGVIGVRLLAARTLQACCDSCHVSVTGAFIELAVSDTGGGIAPALRASVFTPFFTTKEVGKGSGLGLAVVHGLMHDVGGHIVLESGTPSGTVVRLLFPGPIAQGAIGVLPVALPPRA
jgi:signal transduction histidine kinase